MSRIERFGVSLFWDIPGWGRFLFPLPNKISSSTLRTVDKVTRNLPLLADVDLFV